MVVGPAASLLATGTVVGIALAVPIASVMRAALLGLAALDPPSLLGSVGVLALAATAATLPPALRAARIDPVHALREP
jgi:ABC-type antimicrobial peptide transport system permease subunit